MINEAQGKYLIFNGEREIVEGTEHFSHVKNNPLYEVITIIEKTPLFFEEHISRLFETARLLNIQLKVTEDDIRNDFKQLIDSNEIDRGNIKLLIYEDNLLVYQFWDTHPTEEDLKKGINVHFFDYERENPNAKILYTDFKSEISKYLLETGAFEVILRSEDGELLEGGRTNLYFIKDDYVITAPDDRVLKGITRQRLEKILENQKIKVEKRVVHDYELTEVDGAFITGTTVDIVPIHSIETLIFDTEKNPVMKKILEGYEQLQTKYIEENKEELL